MHIDILHIIKNSSLKIKFQPIVSVATQQLVGLEALTRGYVDNTLISPDILFQQAREQHLIRELDYVCHALALKEFATHRHLFSSPLLFINFDSSYISAEDVDKFIVQLKQYDISAQNVVIEINEIENIDFASIKYFADRCRKEQLIVSLDDIGSGFSNLDRLADIKPHIIKADKELAKHIHSSYHKQEIIKSLIDLSHKTGSVIIIEGVESIDDFLLLVSMDAQFFQGFYFACPEYITDLNPVSLSNKLKESLHKKPNSSSFSTINKQFILNVLPLFSNTFKHMALTDISDYLKKHICFYHQLQCIYLLNDSGIQLSDTIFPNNSSFKKNYLSKLYHPACIGTDHTLKKYYTALIPPVVNCNITDRYISLATGRPCITVASVMIDASNTPFILCIDLICD